MRLEGWIIGVMIFLVVGVLGLIAASPDEVSVPKSTHVEVTESVSVKESPTSMPVPVPEMTEEEKPVSKEFAVELEEKISVEEFESEPKPMEVTEDQPATPNLVEISVAEGSLVPGCEEINECYIPSEVSISIGDEIIWNNIDSAAHTVTSGNPTDGPDGIFDSSLFMAGTTFEYTFDEAGTFDYFCMVHPWMIGTVNVE